MAAVCKIPDEQNSERQIGRLAAFSTFYQRAKIVLGIQFILTVPAARVTSVIILLSPEAKVWTTFYSLTVALLDALVLERIQSHFRKLAARTQELFDCELFELEWRFLRVGSKPDSEDIMQAASKYKRKHSGMSLLKDWYPKEVAALALPLARLVCQRANCWWDANLRRKYRGWQRSLELRYAA